MRNRRIMSWRKLEPRASTPDSIAEFTWRPARQTQQRASERNAFELGGDYGEFHPGKEF